MKHLKLFKQLIESNLSESIKYHLDNNKPITENIFRPGSDSFYQVIKEARELFDYGKINLCEVDKEIYESTDIGKFGMFNHKEVPLDLPMEEIEELNEAEYKGVVELLWDIFEGTITPMGYKLLDSHVGCIYGDSISLKRADDICNRLKMKGFASINWVAGIGSYTYQYNTRDTFGMAIKATYCEALSTDGTKYFEIPIFKDPITDDGTKKSARGLLRVDEVPVEGGKTTFVLRDNVSWEEEAGGALVTVFDDGVLVKEYSLQEIRDRLSSDL